MEESIIRGYQLIISGIKDILELLVSGERSSYKCDINIPINLFNYILFNIIIQLDFVFSFESFILFEYKGKNIIIIEQENQIEFIVGT